MNAKYNAEGSADPQRNAMADRAALADHSAPAHRHSGWTILLHWSSVLAIAICTITFLWRDAIEDKTLRVLLLDVHRQAGLFVLLALPLRLAVRAALGFADHAEGVAPLIKLAASLAHAALYAVLLVIPVLGLVATQAHAVSVSLFGLVPLPLMIADDPDVADTLSDWHSWVSWLLLGLVVAHVAAALWHHRTRRDGVLHAMLPWVKRRP